MNFFVAVAPQMVGAERVDGNEHDIRLGFHRCLQAGDENNAGYPQHRQEPGGNHER